MSAAPPGDITALQALTGTFSRPGETFARLVKRPTWWLPFVVMLVTAAASIAAMSPKLDMEKTIRQALDRQEEKTGQTIPPAAVERSIAFGKKFAAVAVPALTVMVTAVFFVTALVLWGGARAFGAEAGFGQVLALWSHANLANAVGAIVSLPIILTIPDASLTREEAEFAVKSNVGAFLSSETPVFVRTLAGSLDVFSLAALGLLVVGFRRLPGLSKASATAVPVTLWVFVVLGKAAIAAARA